MPRDEMTQQQLDKLPKYARLEVEYLKRKVESLQRKMDQLKGDPETALTVWTDWDDTIALPDHGQVTFVMTYKDRKGRHRIGKLTCRMRDGNRLNINNGSPGGIRILPGASNDIDVECRD